MYLMTHYNHLGKPIEKLVSKSFSSLVDSIPMRPGDLLSMGENDALAVTSVGQYRIEEVREVYES